MMLRVLANAAPAVRTTTLTSNYNVRRKLLLARPARRATHASAIRAWATAAVPQARTPPAAQRVTPRVANATHASRANTSTPTSSALRKKRPVHRVRSTTGVLATLAWVTAAACRPFTLLGATCAMLRPASVGHAIPATTSTRTSNARQRTVSLLARHARPMTGALATPAQAAAAASQAHTQPAV